MPEKKLKLKINGKSVSCLPGTTILQAAKTIGIDIPALCQHDDFPSQANCRVCVVEIKGRKCLSTSCSTLVESGMEITTDSDRVKRARSMNLELIYAEHVEKCADCIWRFECKLLEFASKYKLKLTRFNDRKGKRQTFRFANAVEIDGTQCIDCRNCIEACSQLQGIDFLEMKGKGAAQEVVPTADKTKHCILCGQCALHCPVSAAQEQAHYPEVEALLKDDSYITVAQFAPSIRVSIGEDFGMEPGENVTGQVVTALRQLGFDYVFDVNWGADVTTMVEAQELIERIQNKGVLPMMTSCCPAWVNFVEFYRADLIPNLTTSRSPHIHSGGIIKTFWAKEKGIDPKKIRVVSIMPCTAKKYEAKRSEMFIDGEKAVDVVLTNREFSFLMKKNRIDLAKLEPQTADEPIAEYSGAAAIYGASGGVMESALRTAQHLACQGKKDSLCDKRIDFKDVRGIEGFKEATVNIAGNELRIGVVNGIKNIKEVLDNLSDYHYIEVMSCPGGCIGGGGQPIPTNWEIRQKRAAALYALDKGKKIRKAHDNQGVVKVLDWLKKEGHTSEHKVLHTSYKKKLKY
jgi:NADH-quinone oxidoreductase subunit G/NADP-reducing hydrogenase subunit HndD